MCCCQDWSDILSIKAPEAQERKGKGKQQRYFRALSPHRTWCVASVVILCHLMAKYRYRAYPLMRHVLAPGYEPECGFSKASCVCVCCTNIPPSSEIDLQHILGVQIWTLMILYIFRVFAGKKCQAEQLEEEPKTWRRQDTMTSG